MHNYLWYVYILIMTIVQQVSMISIQYFKRSISIFVCVWMDGRMYRQPDSRLLHSLLWFITLPVVEHIAVITDVERPGVERGHIGVPVEVSVYLQEGDIARERTTTFGILHVLLHYPTDFRQLLGYINIYLPVCIPEICTKYTAKRFPPSAKFNKVCDISTRTPVHDHMSKKCIYVRCMPENYLPITQQNNFLPW